MTRRRWIADEVSGDHAVLLGEHAEHLARVLRARVGQQFDVAANGAVRLGTITAVTPHRVDFQLGDALPATGLPNITIVLSIFKFDRMEWAIEKCTELGAARIIPLAARRSEPHLVSSAPKRVERWKRIAQQAAEQCRRISPPQIAQPVELSGATVLPGTTRILLAEAEQDVVLRDAVGGASHEIVLAFGPEGGWAPDELPMFTSAGWKPASLGSTILRTETAVIAALAVVLSILQ